MSLNTEYLLIDHLDNTLKGEALLQVEELIRTDEEIAANWQYLNIAVAAVRHTALYEQVASVNRQFNASKAPVTVSSKPAVIRTLYRTALRVAAFIILFLGSVTVYKYVTLSPESLYHNYYASYDLNTSRGTSNADVLEQAYRSKKWSEVLSRFQDLKEKNTKSYFLAAMADMELKNYDKSINEFNQVIAINTKTGDSYFQDDAEYYLALSLLANHQTTKSIHLLNKIRNDKTHLYNRKVSQMSFLDLKLMEYKGSK